jgi:hypothetical protein
MNFINEIKKGETQIKRLTKKIFPTQKEYIKFVQTRLKDNQYICSAMGSLTIYSVDMENFIKQKNINSNFAKWLESFEWCSNKLYPHDLPYMFNKKRILTKKIEADIDSIYDELAKEYNVPSYYYLVKQNIVINKNTAYMNYLFNGVVSKNIIKIN